MNTSISAGNPYSPRVPYSNSQTIPSGGLDVASAVFNGGKGIHAAVSSDASGAEKIQGIKESVGLAVADYYTAGLASVAYGFANKYFPGVMDTIRELSMKFDPVLKLLGGLFDSDKWKTEGNRLSSLLEKGVNIPEELRAAMSLTRGRSKEELIDHTVSLDFRGLKENGAWVNNLFAQSRGESDLRAEDIWGYSAFFEKFGNDWLGTMTEADRRAIAEKALSLGLVREHHGTIDVEWAPLQSFIQERRGIKQ